MRVLQTQNITSTPNRSASQSILQTKRKRNGSKTFESHEKKQRRRKPGSVALKQIKYYQKSTEYLVPRLPFSMFIREVAETLTSIEVSEYRWKASAIEALQCAAEAYLVYMFEDTNKVAIHAKRVTIKPEDLHIVRDLRARVNSHEMF